MTKTEQTPTKEACPKCGDTKRIFPVLGHPARVYCAGCGASWTSQGGGKNA